MKFVTEYFIFKDSILDFQVGKYVKNNCKL